MNEFFIAFLLFQAPDAAVPSFDALPFATHADCAAAIRVIEDQLTLTFPEGTEIRLSCISSESIGQNSV